MTQDNSGPGAPDHPKTISQPANSARTRSSRSEGRTKKSDRAEVKVPMTFSVSLGFSRKLKMLSASREESVSDYVESKLSPMVTRDLKKVLEEME